MPVIKKMHQDRPNDPEFRFHCVGCGMSHWFKTSGDEPIWTWNGDFKNPTVKPSILVNKSNESHRCHLYIEKGKIRYLNDCHHDLRNKTIDMVSIENEDDAPEKIIHGYGVAK